MHHEAGQLSEDVVLVFAVVCPEDRLGSCVSVDYAATITIMYPRPILATAGPMVGLKDVEYDRRFEIE